LEWLREARRGVTPKNIFSKRRRFAYFFATRIRSKAIVLETKTNEGIEMKDRFTPAKHEELLRKAVDIHGLLAAPTDDKGGITILWRDGSHSHAYAEPHPFDEGYDVTAEHLFRQADVAKLQATYKQLLLEEWARFTATPSGRIFGTKRAELIVPAGLLPASMLKEIDYPFRRAETLKYASVTTRQGCIESFVLGFDPIPEGYVIPYVFTRKVVAEFIHCAYDGNAFADFDHAHLIDQLKSLNIFFVEDANEHAVAWKPFPSHSH